jgi:hypothetical protein
VASQFEALLNYHQRIRTEDDEIEQRMPAAGMTLTKSKSGGDFQQAAEKLERWSETDEKHASAAKATAHSAGFTPGINPRPTARTSSSVTGQDRILEPFEASVEPFRSCVGASVLTALLLACLITPSRAAMARADSPLGSDHPSSTPTSKPHDASLDEYKQHLTTLTTRVESCANARDLKTCDPALVGPDDRIPLAAPGPELLGNAQPGNAQPGKAPTGETQPRRLIRYGWLRVLLSDAQDKDVVAPEAKKEAPAESVRPTQPTTSQLLKAAEIRLAQDLAESDRPLAAPPAHDAQRAVMKQVLAGRDFRNLEAESEEQSALEKFGHWINKLVENASKLTAKSAWLGRVIVWGFIVAVCVGLIWGLIQFERRWRVRLVPDSDRPAPGAASARDWQLWLEDARRAAAAGQWREAIHFVYWASISRLESKRLWPADRARTPREYLALVAPEDVRKTPLAALTRSFERVWYGGRPAGEPEFRRAEEIANGLISGTAVSRLGTEGGAPR